MMTLIRAKSYLKVFMQSLRCTKPQQMSFSKPEFLELIRTRTDNFNALIGQEMKSIYNFMSLGFILSPEEVTEISGEPVLRAFMSSIRESLDTGDVPIYLGIHAIHRFFNTGRVDMPMIGSTVIPTEDRLAYANKYMIRNSDQNRTNHLHLVDAPMPSMVLISFQTFSLIYLLDEPAEREKVFVFSTLLFEEILQDALKSPKIKELELTPDIWTSYVERMLNKQPSFY